MQPGQGLLLTHLDSLCQQYCAVMASDCPNLEAVNVPMPQAKVLKSMLECGPVYGPEFMSLYFENFRSVCSTQGALLRPNSSRIPPKLKQEGPAGDWTFTSAWAQ